MIPVVVSRLGRRVRLQQHRTARLSGVIRSVGPCTEDLVRPWPTSAGFTCRRSARPSTCCGPPSSRTCPTTARAWRPSWSAGAIARRRRRRQEPGRQGRPRTERRKRAACRRPAASPTRTLSGPRATRNCRRTAAWRNVAPASTTGSPRGRRSAWTTAASTTTRAAASSDAAGTRSTSGKPRGTSPTPYRCVSHENHCPGEVRGGCEKGDRRGTSRDARSHLRVGGWEGSSPSRRFYTYGSQYLNIGCRRVQQCRFFYICFRTLSVGRFWP